MKKISQKGMKSYLGLPSDAHNIIKTLRVAKSQTSDPTLEKRYEAAMSAIGLAWLEWVESTYEPELRRYRVHIKGERWLEVMAHDEDEAEQMINSDGIADHERTEEVEEMKE